MGSCSSCGISIPEGQSVCSMCYGDPAYGRDGYYEEWLKQEETGKHESVQETTTSDPLRDPEIPF